MTPKTKIILIGIGSAIVGAAVTIGVCFYLLFNTLSDLEFVEDPEGIALSIDVPLQATLGESVDLSITVYNGRTNAFFNLTQVEIEGFFLLGFEVQSEDPKSDSVQIDDGFEDRIYSYNLEIPPNSTFTITYSLLATKSGVFRGDVDVFERTNFTTAVAQTFVKTSDL